MQKADHSGHRNRLREKYLQGGIEVLAEHEVIELLLFNAVPYRNTNDIAKNLVSRFGSLSAVMDASLELLMDAGLTRNQAMFLKLIPDSARLYMLDKHDNPSKIMDPEHIVSFLLNRFIGLEREEHVIVLLLDEKFKELYCGELTKGSFNAGEISLRRLMNLALTYSAAGVVIAHNHPSGVAMPSQEDYRATIQIHEALSMIGVALVDHYIIADNEAVSMRESGMFD